MVSWRREELFPGRQVLRMNCEHKVKVYPNDVFRLKCSQLTTRGIKLHTAFFVSLKNENCLFVSQYCDGI